MACTEIPPRFMRSATTRARSSGACSPCRRRDRTTASPTYAIAARRGCARRRSGTTRWLRSGLSRASVVAAIVPVAIAIAAVILVPRAPLVRPPLPALLARFLAPPVAVAAGRQANDGDRDAAALDEHERGAGRASAVPVGVALHPVPVVRVEDLFVLLRHHLDAGLHDHERRRGGERDLDPHGDLRAGGERREREREGDRQTGSLHAATVKALWRGKKGPQVRAGESGAPGATAR